MLQDGINTHYLAVKSRVLAVNPSRKFIGIMSAQDWPPQDIFTEAFYLLTLGDAPLGKQAYSASIPVVVHTAQWTWMVVGTDIQTGIQMRGRGDRYQTHFQMKGELLNGGYPGFAQKQNVTIDGNGNLVLTPASPSDYIVWSPLSMIDNNEKASGVYYGKATVKITDFTDFIS